MAYTYDVNKVPANGAVAMYRLKTLLKSVGWTVTASSDGTTLNASGDQITHDGTGAGGMRNLRAWFVIQQPGALPRQFCFQRSSDAVGTNSGNWRIKYSAGPSTGFVTGATATQVPSATDEQVIMGAGTDASPTFSAFMTTDGTPPRVNMFAGGAAENYNFFFVGHNVLSSSAGVVQNTKFALALDMLETYSVGDPDPSVIVTDWSQSSNTLAGSFIASTGSTGGAFTWFRKGLSGAGFARLTPLLPALSTTNIAGAHTPNQLSLNDELLPVIYARPTSLTAPTGFKGISGLFKWVLPTRAHGTHLRVSSERDRVVVGLLAVPWNGSVMEM